MLAALAARVHDADVADDAAEAKAAFHLRMRARGIQDISVLRAFEIVPRQAFVPRRYLDLAQRDLALPIDCGQTLPEPWLVARLIEAAKVERKHRVLEIGAGTGYATAILSHLAADVISLERYQSLAIAAQARLDAQGIENAAVVWGRWPGAAGLARPGRPDRRSRPARPGAGDADGPAGWGRHAGVCAAGGERAGGDEGGEGAGRRAHLDGARALQPAADPARARGDAVSANPSPAGGEKERARLLPRHLVPALE